MDRRMDGFYGLRRLLLWVYLRGSQVEDIPGSRCEHKNSFSHFQSDGFILGTVAERPETCYSSSTYLTLFVTSVQSCRGPRLLM